MKRLSRPLLLAASLTLVLGAAALTALLLPVATDAAAGPAGGDIASVECRARVAEAGHGFAVTLASLSNASRAGRTERCDAYRAHVVALADAREVYATCLTGFARDDQVSQIDLAAGNWRSAIAANCAD